MRICVLASGSKGNAILVVHHETYILIDLGVSCSYLLEQLSKLNIDPNRIKHVFLTHTHTDHIYGLKVFVKNYHPQLYLKEGMINDLSAVLDHNYTIMDSVFNIDQLEIECFYTSHDAADSVGYVIKADHKSLAYVTDTGYINEKYFKILTDCDMYIMESNHDIEKLMNGKYPYHLKKRILGDKGHLSNNDCAYYLSHLIGSKTKYIVLSHLSEENNSPSLAYETLVSTLKENNQHVDNIYVASQHEMLEAIEV